MDDPLIVSSTHPEVNWTNAYFTDNLLLAAALCTIGIPWKMRKEGAVRNGHHINDRVQFQFANEVTIAPVKPHDPPIKYNTRNLVKMLEEGTLEKIDPEHPLCYAMQAILNRSNLLKAINEQRHVWRFSKAGGPISAVVHDGREKSFDTISRFFKRTGRHYGKVNPLG